MTVHRESDRTRPAPFFTGFYQRLVTKFGFLMHRRALTRHHRWTGIVLLLPFLAWSLTGIFFLVRPGYDEAYERVPVRQYDLPTTINLEVDPSWKEIRLFRSVLGDHLIIQDATGWHHLAAGTLEEWPLPDEDDLALLLQDAFQFNPDRYGRVTSVTDNTARTDTGVILNVSWPTLSITQDGRDSRWIDRIYSIHYLEWTGYLITDRILGLSGLALLIYMTYTGALMAFGKKRSS